MYIQTETEIERKRGGERDEERERECLYSIYRVARETLPAQGRNVL